MATDKLTRIKHIEQKQASFEKQIERLQIYLSLETMNKHVAELRSENLTTLYKECVRYNDELALLQPDHPALEIFINIEDSYFEVAAAVKALELVEVQNSTFNNMSIVERQDTPKLPRINLPIFDGSHDKWLAFKNKFEILVHSRANISNVIKHTQLENALTGDALNKISEFPPSEENYPKAWAALLDAYDQARMLVTEHLDAIFDLPIVPKPTVNDLSALIDKAKQHLHMLAQLGVNFDDVIIVRILERRLPTSTRVKWEEKLDMKKLPTLGQFYDFVRGVIFNLRSIQRIPKILQEGSRKRSREFVVQSQNSKAGSNAKVYITSSITPSNSVSTAQCVRCKKGHPIYKCPAFNQDSVSQRWDFVKGHKLCRNCLVAHQQPCKCKSRCKKCKHDHHTLLHRETRSPLVDSSNVNRNTEGEVAKKT